jgi:hypothetical protein
MDGFKNMTTPANEWREKLRLEISFIESSNLKSVEDFREAILDVCQSTIQTLLTTHSAHLVERIEKAKLDEKKVNNDLNLIGQISIYNEALDQAIDIIKDNK